MFLVCDVILHKKLLKKERNIVNFPKVLKQKEVKIFCYNFFLNESFNNRVLLYVDD